MRITHLIGLLLGTEDDWPSAFEALMRRVDPQVELGGHTHAFETGRVTIEPFDLRAVPRYGLVVDRLAWWYDLPREWLKKVALMDDVYLLNSPFTFQAMEKHAAYCAMIRLGLKVPRTWMVPHKRPPANPRFEAMAARYVRPFELEQVADAVGLPLFLKPFDGGQWVGVSRVASYAELHERYDESGERLLHVQESIEGYDVFARSLSIGAETLVMRFRPERPMFDRYAVEHGFLASRQGEEVVTISRVVNAFFRWEFNSCELLVRGEDVHPIDYANASPDVSLTSLHYYFPWAIAALLRWCVFCAATGRRTQVDQDTRRWFDVADREGQGYDERLAEYRRLADAYFEAERYHAFCERYLGDVDAALVEYVRSGEFDDLLVATVRATFPPPEHERFVAHYRGLLRAWADDQG